MSLGKHKNNKHTRMVVVESRESCTYFQRWLCALTAKTLSSGMPTDYAAHVMNVNVFRVMTFYRCAPVRRLP